MTNQNNSNTNNENNASNNQPHSFIPYEAFNTTLNSGFNPNDYYGLPQENCNVQGCVPNVVNQELYPIPSVEEIAAFNTQQIGGGVAGSSPITDAATTAQYLSEGAPSVGMQSTPSTTFTSGATIDQSVTDGASGGITDIKNPYPVTPESLQYLNGFLRTQIGRRVSIDFLVGSNTIVTKSGFLLGVASNYILINELDTNDLTTCDFYNIKFIRFYY